jgi:hypothetical protein
MQRSRPATCQCFEEPSVRSDGRGEHESAKYCRDSIEVVTAALREARQPAKSTPYTPTRRETPLQVIPTPTEAPRIARGYRRT